MSDTTTKPRATDLTGAGTEEGFHGRINLIGDLPDPESKIAKLREMIESRIECHDVLGDDAGDACDYWYLKLCDHWLVYLEDGFRSGDFVDISGDEPQDDGDRFIVSMPGVY